MNDERFDGLLQQLLDDELSSEGAVELADQLRAEPKRVDEVRRHLVLWELWSQTQAPERSAEAFGRSVRVRVRAETEGEAFVAQLERRLGRSIRGGTIGQRLAPAFRALRRHLALSLTAASVAGVALMAWFLVTPHSAQAKITLRGEAVCTACALHETRAHLPAIRVHEGTRTLVYYVNAGRFSIVRLGDYCRAPVPLIAVGATEQHAGRFTIDVIEAQRVKPDAGRDPSDGPVLFPF